MTLSLQINTKFILVIALIAILSGFAIANCISNADYSSTYTVDLNNEDDSVAETQAKSNCKAPSNTYCASGFDESVEVEQVSKDTSTWVYTFKCRKVCKHASGECLDKEGFDSQNFRPFDGKIKNGGQVRDYYSGAVSCFDPAPCHFSTADNIVLRGSFSKINVTSGKLSFFDGNLEEGIVVNGINMRGDVSFSYDSSAAISLPSIAGLDTSGLTGKLKIAVRSGEINGSIITGAEIIVDDKGNIYFTGNLQGYPASFGGVLVTSYTPNSPATDAFYYDAANRTLHLPANASIDFYDHLEDGLKIEGDNIRLFSIQNPGTLSYLTNGTLAVMGGRLVSDPLNPAIVDGVQLSAEGILIPSYISGGFVEFSADEFGGEEYARMEEGDGNLAFSSGEASGCAAKGTITDKIARIKTNSKCFQTVDGEPFYPIADTAWLLFRLSDADIEKYIKTRKEQGFNVIKFDGVGISNLPIDYNKLDTIFNLLEKYKMYAEPGLHCLKADKSLEFVKRYKGRDIIWTWIVGCLDDSGGTVQLANDLGLKVKREDPNHLMSYHPKAHKSTYSYPDLEYEDFEYVHSYSVGWAATLISEALAGQESEPESEPVYLGEPVYDDPKRNPNPEAVRAELEEAFEAGPAGMSYGNNNVWLGCKTKTESPINNPAYVCYDTLLNSLKSTSVDFLSSIFGASGGITGGAVDSFEEGQPNAENRISASMKRPLNAEFGSDSIKSSKGKNTQYYYRGSNFYREGDPNKGMHLLGSYASFDFTSANTVVEIGDENALSFEVLRKGSVYVENRKEAGKAPLAETISDTAIRNGDYLFSTENSELKLNVNFIFSNSGKSEVSLDVVPMKIYQKDQTTIDPIMTDKNGNSAYLQIREGETSIIQNKNAGAGDDEIPIVTSLLGMRSLLAKITGMAVEDYSSKTSGKLLSIKDKRSQE